MKLIYFLANNPCEDPEILKIILYIRSIMKIAFIVIPIVLIVLITFDFIKSVTAGNEDTMKKNQKIVIKRIVYCLMVFFVMPIVNIAFSAFKTSGQESLISDGNGVNYLSCWANAEDIESINLLTIKPFFDLDGGELMGGTSHECGGNIECDIVLPNARKTGYIFKGWIKNGSDETYQVGEKVTIRENDTFKAKWEEKVEEEKVPTNEEILDKENDNTLEGDKNKTPTTPITLSDDIETRI